MGVYLYDVNIPEDKALTIKIYPDGRATCDDGKYLTHVIITEVKPSHGNLIDADSLMESFASVEFSSNMEDTMEILDNYPIVIEAETE